LDQLADRLALRGVEQLHELGQVGFDALVLTGDGRDEGPLGCRIADLMEAVAH
jgi:hypothetical protein